MRSGIWTTRQLAVNPSNGAGLTIQDAMQMWYENPNMTFEFRDDCQGPYCNTDCPEEFTLGELDSNNWPSEAKIILVIVVLVITVASLMLKVMFMMWYYQLQRNQQLYLKSLNLSTSEEAKVQVCVYQCGRWRSM